LDGVRIGKSEGENYWKKFSLEKIFFGKVSSAV
jgi:hypothetical protein